MTDRLDEHTVKELNLREMGRGPNLLSISRIAVAVLIIWFYEQSGHHITWTIMGLVVYGILSDYLDGYLARRRGEISELGKALDPVSDKLSSGLLFLYAVWIGRIPVAYLGFVVARDLLIMSASLYIRRLTGRMPGAIMSGKVSINAVAAYWIAAFFTPEAVAVVKTLMWISIALMMYSFGDYIVRYARTYKEIKWNREKT